MKHITMSKIGKFTDTIQDIKRRVYYVDTLENGDIVLDETRKLPEVTYSCTVKTHGTFAGIVYDGQDIQAESKGNLITTKDDNAGFAEFVEYNKDYFKLCMSELCVENDLEEVAIMGEWVGKGINKGTAIHQLPNKTYIMFGIKFKIRGEEGYKWSQMPWEILKVISDKELNIRSVFEFDHKNITVDYNNPKEALIELDRFLDRIENECPVGRDYGISGIGEGFVANGYFNDEHFMFKHKGEKFAQASKVKQPREVDPREQEKLDFADTVTPTWRMDQGITEICKLNNGGTIEMTKLGDIILWVRQDIIDEEQPLFRDKKLEIEDVQKFISNIVRDYVKQEILHEALGE